MDRSFLGFLARPSSLPLPHQPFQDMACCAEGKPENAGNLSLDTTLLHTIEPGSVKGSDDSRFLSSSVGRLR
jgi:hypothetical protein